MAEAIAGCKIFVPLYCGAYFASDFCHWELQLAIVRDPTGSRGIVRPFLLEPVKLPEYCRLIQAEQPGLEKFAERLLGILRS